MIDLLFLKIRVFLGGRDDQIVAALPQNIGERLGNFRKERMQQVWSNQPNQIRAPRDQAACRQIGAIVKLFNAGENSLAGLIAYIRMIAEHLGDGDHRYPKVSGNVLHSSAHDGYSVYRTLNAAMSSR